MYKFFKKTKENLTIKEIVLSGLCLGCGTCLTVCPKNAINLKVDFKKGIYQAEICGDCNKCGLCYYVCPGKGIPLIKMGKNLFPFGIQSPVGQYISCYTGYSKDQYERFSSSSGGLVTALLKMLFYKKKIDGAILTSYDARNLKAYPVIAKSEEEIERCKGSKYSPVPINVILKKVLLEENKKFAFVGLPCHIQGLRLAMNVLPSLKEKIVIILGLFCGGMLNLNATLQVLKRKNINFEKVIDLSFRGNGWPGVMKIKTLDNKIFLLPYPKYFKGLGYLEPYRCCLCPDALGELADISFGDAWLPRYRNDVNGYSIVIARSLKGEMLIKESVKLKRIVAEPVSLKDVLISQHVNIEIKRLTMGARRLRYSLLFKKLPLYDIDFKIYLKGIYKDLRVSIGKIINMLIAKLKFYFYK